MVRAAGGRYDRAASELDLQHLRTRSFRGARNRLRRPVIDLYAIAHGAIDAGLERVLLGSVAARRGGLTRRLSSWSPPDGLWPKALDPMQEPRASPHPVLWRAGALEADTFGPLLAHLAPMAAAAVDSRR